MTSLAKRLEPRWPASIALLSVGGLRLILPRAFSFGPNWVLLVVVGLLVVPIVWAHYGGLNVLNRILGHLVTAIVTADMIWSLSLLITTIPDRKIAPQEMLRSAAALWVANILVFASWYWRLDAGGPREREMRGVHTDGAFLFPQMTLDRDAKRDMGEDQWSPGFIDYLFLAFNVSTAFSPSDSPILSRWAKTLVMIQALISFTTVALLAARAINIL
jgi:hypothetical protein